MPTNTTSIVELARAKWRASGIDDDWAGVLKFEALTRDKVKALGPTFIHAGALRIPYFTPEGTPSKFYRIRYLETLPGFAGAVVKPRRYAQAPGTVSEVYLPPIFGQTTWASILADSEVTLHITEGELKAASACLLNFPTIGLGGVDVWRSSKRGLAMLPILDQTTWKGRSVFIIYDSDAASNPNVLRAQHTLADELTERGALVRIASLPAGPNGEKMGLDDYIVSKGADAAAELQDLLDHTPGLSESKSLWNLNEEVAYVRDPGLIVVRANGSKLKPQAFTAHAYANRHYYAEKPVKDGNVVLVKKPLAMRWIEWEARAELAKVVYTPGAPQITAQGEWNDWPGWGCEPESGDIGPWEWLLDFLFKDKEAERIWFEQWLAYPIQHPGAKLLSSAVIWGVAQGTGKTLVGHTMLRIYGANGVEIDDSDLEGDYNSWALNKQFVMGDEITGSDSRARANKLKGMITRREFQVHVKYLPEYSLIDCVNYLFTSNGPDAFFLDDEDRRYFIHEVIGNPAPIEKYKWYDRWLKTVGPSALFAHLLELDLEGFDPKAPAMKTEARRAMIADGRSDLATWCAALRAEPERMLTVLGARAAGECELFTASQLLQAYDPTGSTRVTAPGMGRELRRARFRSFSEAPVKTSAGLQRLLIVRNQDKWMREGVSAKDAGAHWDTYFGEGSGKF